MAIELTKAVFTVSKDREQDVVNYLECEDRPGCTVEYQCWSNDEMTSTFELMPYFPDQCEEFANVLVPGVLAL